MQFEQTDEDTETTDANGSTSSSRRDLIEYGGISLLLIGSAGGVFYLETTEDSNDNGESITAEELKNQASEYEYNDLLRNPEEYEGEYVHFESAQVEQVIEYEDGFRLRTYVNEADTGWEDDIYIVWRGERFLQEDIIRVWGRCDGLFTYESTLGNQRTIPLVSGLLIELIEEA